MTAPAAYEQLRARMAELSDLHALGALMFWDQSTMMPAGGVGARAHQAATLERVCHAKLTDPEVGRLLDAAEPWAAGQDPDSDEARLVAVVRRDFEKAVRVPDDLAADMARAAALGEQAWQEARAANDFGRFRDALAEHIELRRRYVACFDGYAHPYDVLLDDFERDLTLAEIRPLFEQLRESLVPLVAEAARATAADPTIAAVLQGDFPQPEQELALREVMAIMGFDATAWRLDRSAHPFAQALSIEDVRITTKFDSRDLAVSFYSTLHEFGHGLYEAGVSPELARTPLGELTSLGLHESQSRLWENIVGRSREYCAWVLPHLRQHFPVQLGAVDAEALHRGVNAVQPSLIRIYADETTYNLHIILRMELEVALLEGTLGVDELPNAWNEAMHRLLGVEVTSDADGVLQDIHWGAGLIGYFPTYTIGNVMSAQIWDALRRDLPSVDDEIARGEFAPLRGWLREHVHRHGRRYAPRELLRRVTGEDLRVEPYLRYLGAKLGGAGFIDA
jgi:carboxypeptidase Taq